MNWSAHPEIIQLPSPHEKHKGMQNITELINTYFIDKSRKNKLE